jgi:glycerol-3-phosphate dehydrogenase
VKKSFSRDCYPLDISRRHRVFRDPDIPWITAYGGKITGCISMAKQIVAVLSRIIPASGLGCRGKTPIPSNHDVASFPGLEEKVPSLPWCIKHEYCCTLEDYLRRRTSISQWVPREGLGWNGENLPYLKKLALMLTDNNMRNAEEILRTYSMRVKNRFDKIIEMV